MSAIDDLIAQIEDRALRERLKIEIRQKYNYQGHKLGNALGQVKKYDTRH